MLLEHSYYYLIGTIMKFIKNKIIDFATYFMQDSERTSDSKPFLLEISKLLNILMCF